MVIGQLILKLGVQAENLEALRQFETGANRGAVAARGAATGTGLLAAAQGKGTLTSLKLTDTIRKGVLELNKYKLVVIAVIAGLTGLSKAAGVVALNLTRFESNTGLSAEKLQEWQQQAALSGIAADEMADSIMGLQRAQQEIAMGGGNVAPFAMLGVNPQANTFDLLDQLHNKLNAVSAAKGTLFGEQMGLSPNMIAFLREGKRPGSDKALLLSKEEIIRLREFNMYFNRVWDNIKRSAQKAGAILAPIATAVVWAIERFRMAFADLADIFSKWGDNLEGLKKYKVALVIFLTGLAAALFPVATAAMLVALAFEDIMSFMRGDNSAIGAMIGWFIDWKRALWDVGLAIAAVIEGMEFMTGLRLKDYAVSKATGQPMPKSAGETMADMINELASKGFGLQYNDAKMAAMNKQGDVITREYDQKTPVVNVHNTVNVDKDGKTSIKTRLDDKVKKTKSEINAMIQGATLQMSPAEGSGQ